MPKSVCSREGELAQLTKVVDTVGPPLQEELERMAHLRDVAWIPLRKGALAPPMRSLVPGASEDALGLLRRMLVR